ncbi:hypothetical protein HK096_004344, partial [Nowakowskiella sp. JEL0078]
MHAGIPALLLVSLAGVFSAPSLAVFSAQANCTLLELLTPAASNFSAAFVYSIPNQRFAQATPPAAIIYPKSASDVQNAVACVSAAGYSLRVRSGGHSYEGLSSISPNPFIIIDLRDLSSVSVDVTAATAVVGAGATLGELYYYVNQASSTLAFPAGVCPTVGLGGLISGGGWGVLGRKYGLSIDHVLSIQFVTAKGVLLSCSSSSNPDLFWALRGGGGGNFGIVVQYTLGLVSVPSTVTFGSISTSISQGVSFLQQYQSWISNDKNLELTTKIYMDTSVISLEVVYLGSRSNAVSLLAGSPVASLITTSNLKEGSWADAILYFTKVASLTDLLSRYAADRPSFYASSDFVGSALSSQGITTLVNSLSSTYSGTPYIIIDGYANGLATKPLSSDTAFPHRNVLFCIQYQATYSSNGDSANTWLKSTQNAMAPYVTGGSYVNYINLNFGTDVPTLTSLSTKVPDPPAWAKRYFAGNWERLAKVKATVDFGDLFNGPQSIPVVVLASVSGLNATSTTSSKTTTETGSGSTVSTKSNASHQVHEFTNFGILL